MAMPLMRGVGPTLIPRPQRTYLRFGEPIDTTKPEGESAAEHWVASVQKHRPSVARSNTSDLLAVRAEDPFRELNPLGLAPRGGGRLRRAHRG